MNLKQSLNTVIIALLGSSFSALAPGEQTSPCSPRDIMSVNEFSAAGLDKLTDQELIELGRWMACEPEAEHPAAAPTAAVATAAAISAVQEPAATQVPQTVETSTPAPSESAVEVYPIRTKVQGEFSGWTGKTTFQLENGQIWRQRNKGKHRYGGKDKNVTISKNLIGLHWLKIDTTGAKVAVTRVK